jgi:hypothetical protein
VPQQVSRILKIGFWPTVGQKNCLRGLDGGLSLPNLTKEIVSHGQLEVNKRQWIQKANRMIHDFIGSQLSLPTS